MTDFLNFNKDPANDIDTAPEQYHRFGGKAVRVQVYWTQDVWRSASSWLNSWSLLKAADAVLRKYTLSLDMQPVGPGPAWHAQVRGKLNREFEKAVGPKLSRLVKANGRVADFLGEIADTLIDETGATAQGLRSFSGAMSIPIEGEPPIDQLKALRSSLGTLAEESRLVIVFARNDGGPNGYTVLRPEWLPWVIADPRPVQDLPDTMLIHEIGHACRLAHQQSNTASAAVRNIMYPLDRLGLDQLWGWQADTIYDSYWCNGRKPTNWWDRTSDARLPPDHPFLWDEPP